MRLHHLPHRRARPVVRVRAAQVVRHLPAVGVPGLLGFSGPLDRAGTVTASPLPSRKKRDRMRGFALRACRSVADGMRDAASLLGSGRTLVVAGSFGYLAFDIAALGACFAATGEVPPLGDLVLAYTIGQLG